MDIKCQHIKTGEIKELPEKVFAQVQHKYKFLSFVQDPNVKPLPPQPVASPVVPPVAANKEEGPDGGLVDEEVVETIEELRARYVETTGKKAGNKSRLTLQKELNEI